MTDDDARPGFDRRALIKKGLVAGGIAATVPVITTFNTAAFAASQPGYHALQFLIAASGTVSQVARDSIACVPSAAPHTGNWATAATGLATATAAGPVSNVYTFMLIGSYSSCEFVDATAIRNNAGTCLTASSFGGIGTNTLTFNRTLLASGNVANIRLLAFC